MGGQDWTDLRKDSFLLLWCQYPTRRNLWTSHLRIVEHYHICTRRGSNLPRKGVSSKSALLCPPEIQQKRRNSSQIHLTKRRQVRVDRWATLKWANCTAWSIRNEYKAINPAGISRLPIRYKWFRECKYLGVEDKAADEGQEDGRSVALIWKLLHFIHFAYHNPIISSNII